MRNLVKNLRIAGALAGLGLLGACGDPPPLFVDGAYVRLNPNPDNPAAGYFIIHGGPSDVTLRAIQTDSAVRLEMHETMIEGGLTTMKPLETVDVPAKTNVVFAPSGKHLMIWKINPQAISAGKMELKLIFSNGERLLVDAVIQAPDGTATGNSKEAPTAGTTQSETEVH
jgi:periplasmic copper chaperone A